MGYHMTKEQAERLAGLKGAQGWQAKPYPDRHGSYQNNFKPDPTTWGVWDNVESCWVFNNESGGSKRA